MLPVRVIPYMCASVYNTCGCFAPTDHGFPISSPYFAASGTRVSDIKSDKDLYRGQDISVKGFATIDNVVLINVEVGGSLKSGMGMGRGGYQRARCLAGQGLRNGADSLSPFFPTGNRNGRRAWYCIGHLLHCSRCQHQRYHDQPGKAESQKGVMCCVKTDISCFKVVEIWVVEVVMKQSEYLPLRQASSEQSICFAVKKEDGDQAVKVLEQRCALYT